MQHIRDELRQRIRAERDGLRDAEQRAAADAIVTNVRSALGHIRDESVSGVVAGYLPTGGEIDPSATLQSLRADGWEIVLPVCGVDASMEFCPWEPGDPLAPNKYGILEPISAPVGIESIDVVLVPGVGFGRDGSRIGHGVGYYDRYFARCFAAQHDPVRLGLAHDLQIVDLPTPEPWDVSMHCVISPSETVMIGFA